MLYVVRYMSLSRCIAPHVMTASARDGAAPSGGVDTLARVCHYPDKIFEASVDITPHGCHTFRCSCAVAWMVDQSIHFYILVVHAPPAQINQ